MQGSNPKPGVVSQVDRAKEIWRRIPGESFCSACWPKNSSDVMNQT
jgi:hypothetical protein